VRIKRIDRACIFISMQRQLWLSLRFFWTCERSVSARWPENQGNQHAGGKPDKPRERYMVLRRSVRHVLHRQPPGLFE